VTGYRRLVYKPTACLACLMRDGEFFEVEEELSDHPAGKAELPGNLIESSSPLAFETICYNGDAIIIRTASGKFLSVTPNHPVLTDRGWVAAKFVKVGDNVLSHSVCNWTSDSMIPDKKHIPTVVEKIPSAFNMLRLGRVPKSAQNLYSQREDGKVDVVFANRFLWDSFDTTFKQQTKKKLFGRGDIRLIPFNTFSNFTKMLKRKFLASSPLLGVSDSGFSFSDSHISPSVVSGFRTSTTFDIVSNKDSFNNLSGNIELLRNSLFRNSRLVETNNIGFRHNEFIPGVSGNFDAFNLRNFGFTPKEPVSLEIIRQGLLSSIPSASGNLATIASNIVFDSVVDVGVRFFSGHVYSLQTKEEWYSSNNIISHNCTAIANIRGVKDVQWETGKQWFNKLSPDEQRAKMGAEKYQLWKDGQFKLEDLSRLQHSTVWGDSPRVATISELLASRVESLDSLVDNIYNDVIRDFPELSNISNNVKFVRGQGFPEWDSENNSITLPGYLENKSITEIMNTYRNDIGGINQVIYHEYGHPIINTLVINSSDEFYETYKNTIEGLIEKLGYPTEYSKKNRNEWIAERYSFEKLGKLEKILIPELKKLYKLRFGL
jgi:hypothetical protein